MIALLVAALAMASPQSQDVGEVAFANSGSPAAQEAFLRGLALLHNFEYGPAAESFRAAQKIDPEFAMAFWGEAMTFNHPLWAQQDAEAARAVLARAPRGKTPRERDYLHTLDVLYGEGTKHERDLKYADAMAALHDRYPEDVDATALYALSLLGTTAERRDYATYMRAAALLEELFPAHQHHPGVLHYLIHSYDDPVHAPLGVRAARLYGNVAPNAGHALHMTSHIYVAMGMWDEVIDANRRAVDVVNRSRAAKSLPPQACGHYRIWLEYGYLQEERFGEARTVMDECRASALTETGQAKNLSLDPEYSSTASYATMRALYAGSGGRIEPPDPFSVSDPAFVAAKFTIAYSDALAALQRGDATAVNDAVSRAHAAAREIGAINKPHEKGSERVAVVLMEIDALQSIAAGKHAEAIALLRKTVDAEEAMAFQFGPPAVEKPAVELLADELLATGRTAEAEESYRAALRRTPGRTRALEGLFAAQKALGKNEDAARTAALLDRYRRPAGAPPATSKQ
ncbi:MAG TPA: hypothetical protein VF980_14425 [Thermoanaerobaculia bacterium]